MTNLTKLASAKLVNTNLYFEVIAFETRDGEHRIVVIAAAEAAKPTKLMDCLRNAGAELDHDATKAKLMVQRLISEKPRRRGTIVIDSGWHGSPGRVFLYGGEKISARRSRSKPHSAHSKRQGGAKRTIFAIPRFKLRDTLNYVGRDGTPDQADGKFMRVGTVESWKRKVAEPAASSTRAMFFIASAFAAPCSLWLDIMPFCLVLVGGSSTGKTACTLAAASVIGFGDEMSLATWHITPSRLEQLSHLHRDLILPIDDLATLAGGPREQFEKVTNLAHWLSHGGRRERLSDAGAEAINRPVPRDGSRTIVLTSSEVSLADLAAQARRPLQSGVTVRLVEIPAVPSGAAGVIDSLPGNTASGRRAAKTIVERLKKGASRNQGEVFVSWLRHLAESPREETEERLKQLSRRFVRRCQKVSTEETALRVADKFGAIYAAGRMAIDAGFLPWDVSRFRDAVLTCFRDAIIGAVDRPAIDDAMAKLREHLADNTRISPVRPSKGGLKDGWREAGNDGEVTYVPGEVFRSWFATPVRRRLEQTLLKDGRLIPGSGRALTHQKALRGSVDRLRVYAFKP